mgnify:CR=1 FL=1
MKFSTLLRVLLVFMCLTVACTSIDNQIKAQSVKVLTLDEVLEIAQRQSPDALSAMHKFRSSYWQYRNYQATLMPMLTLDATIPSLSRNIEKITTREGDFFVERNLANYAGGLSLSKNLGLTGGSIFLRSDLQRIDIFGDSTRTSYLSSPINIGISQPLFGYNKYKWSKKIEPLRYTEAERRYLEDQEQINISATSAFFALLSAQIYLQIQQTNLANNDTLYQIARGRFNIGTIAENELLEAELSLLTSRSNMEVAILGVEMRTFDLKSYLRLPEDVSIELVAPIAPPMVHIDPVFAINEARNNRSDALAFERMIFEAESKVAEAKAKNRFNIDLYAMYGLTQSTVDFNDIFRHPQDQQRLEIGVRIPILDWGLGRGEVKLAESNREVARTDVQQGIVDFDKEVLLKIMQYNMQPSQYAIATKSDTVALKRFEVTKQRYMIGKIDIIDLRLAQTEKDDARQRFVNSLATFWDSYFEMRRLTLFDFVNNNRIEFDFNKIPEVN